MENLVKNQEKVKDRVEIAVEFLTNLFNLMNISAKITKFETEKAIILQINSSEASLLIGTRGENIQAIQTLLNNLTKSSTNFVKKILIDVADYRKNKMQKLEEQVKNAIEKCLKTAKPISLDYMNAYERFAVHDIVLQDGRVVSESFGREPRRFVKIFIK